MPDCQFSYEKNNIIWEFLKCMLLCLVVLLHTCQRSSMKQFYFLRIYSAIVGFLGLGGQLQVISAHYDIF